MTNFSKKSICEGIFYNTLRHLTKHVNNTVNVCLLRHNYCRAQHLIFPGNGFDEQTNLHISMQSNILPMSPQGFNYYAVESIHIVNNKSKVPIILDCLSCVCINRTSIVRKVRYQNFVSRNKIPFISSLPNFCCLSSKSFCRNQICAVRQFRVFHAVYELLLSLRVEYYFTVTNHKTTKTLMFFIIVESIEK